MRRTAKAYKRNALELEQLTNSIVFFFVVGIVIGGPVILAFTMGLLK